MADPRDQGSELGQLYGDGGGSKIDQLYGSPRKDDATKAAEMERRVEQKMYRDAVRNKDYKAVAGFHAKPGFQATGGITRHGQFDAQDRKTGENFTQEGNRLYNNGQQGANEIDRAAKPLGTGAGDSPQNAAGGSSGGDWVNVGPSATKEAATSPSGSGAPATDQPADWRQERQAALDAARKEIASRSGPSDPFATATPIDPKYQATPEQITEAASESFSKSYGDYLNGEGKNATREQKDAKYAELKKANPKFQASQSAKDAVEISFPERKFTDEVNALLPGARIEMANLETLGSDMGGGLGNYGARKSARESRQSIVEGSMTPTQANDLKEDIPAESNPFNDWLGNTLSSQSRRPETKSVKQDSSVAAKEDATDLPNLLDLSKPQNLGMSAWFGVREAGKWLSNGAIPKTLKKINGAITNDPIMKWNEDLKAQTIIPPTTAKVDKEREAASMWG